MVEWWDGHRSPAHPLPTTHSTHRPIRSVPPILLTGPSAPYHPFYSPAHPLPTTHSTHRPIRSLPPMQPLPPIESLPAIRSPPLPPLTSPSNPYIPIRSLPLTFLTSPRPKKRIALFCWSSMCASAIPRDPSGPRNAIPGPVIEEIVAMKRLIRFQLRPNAQVSAHSTSTNAAKMVRRHLPIVA